MVLIDTSVWSPLLRSRHGRGDPLFALSLAVRDLLGQGEVAMIGAVRQEILTGIRSPELYIEFRDYLRYFPNEPLDIDDFETAAEFANSCAAAGIQGSFTDFLICAVAIRRSWDVVTVDRDFERYATVLPLRLFKVSQDD